MKTRSVLRARRTNVRQGNCNVGRVSYYMYIDINICTNTDTHRHTQTCTYMHIYRKELEEKLQRAEREAENATADALKLRQDKLRAETRARELEEGKNSEKSWISKF